MILLIDNYDSFTYNLYQYIGIFNSDIKVVRNDKITIEEIKAMDPERIVLSPGPKNPKEAGICMDVVKEFTEEKSAYNAAMSYMLKKVVINSEKEITIDFNRVLVSTGSLMPVFEGTATASEGKMFFNWKDNSGMGNAEDTDITMVLAYNKDKGMAVYDTEAGFRQDEAAELMIPDEWQDDELIAYLSFRSADGSSVANSVRMARKR